VSDIAVAMRDFMVFHAAREIVIECSEPAVFVVKLLKKL
jgi:hypothetical protein